MDTASAEAREFHPVSSLFPLMEGQAFTALTEDIRENGLREPIYVDADGLILDGRNRYRACLKAQVDPEFRTWEGNGDPLGFVLSENIHRRHLSESQKAMVAARVCTLPRGRPGNAAPAAITQGEAAELLKVSPDSIQRARKVISDGVPELVAEVDAGSMPVASAAGLTKEDRDVQARIVARIPETRAGSPARRVKIAKALVRKELIQERAKSEEGTLPADGLLRDLSASELQGAFRTIYADPPWPYDGRTDNSDGTQHYPQMPLEEICDLPVEGLAHVEDGAHLWLWTTWPMIRSKAAHKVVEAWGFRWVGEIVWNKMRIGTGYFLRSQTEVLVLGVRENLNVLEHDQGNYLEALRGKHSEKPEQARQIIERLSPGPRIELFARAAVQGWRRWGLEAQARRPL